MNAESEFWSCRFRPNGRQILVCERKTPWQSGVSWVRLWDCQARRFADVQYENLTTTGTSVGDFLDNDHCLVGLTGWKVIVLDVNSFQVVHSFDVSGRPQGLSVSTSRREFCVGDSSGFVRFYDAQTYEPSQIKLKLPGPVQDTCYSRDGRWLATVCLVDGELELRFWHLTGEAPYPSLVMQFPYPGVQGLHGIGERGFVFAEGDRDIRMIELPAAPSDLETCELTTWLATALERSASGGLDLIPSHKYSHLRARLAEKQPMY
jgi:WD40 repeat protein